MLDFREFSPYMYPLPSFDISTQLGLMNYIIDVYLFVSASALAATVVARSAFGAAFPVSVLLGPGTIVLTTISVICVSDVRKTRTGMGVFSRRLYRPCVDSCTVRFVQVRTGDPIQIQICTPTAIVQGVCLDTVVH